MSRKRPRSLSPIPPTDIYRSSPIEDRTSTFIAFFSPTLSAATVQAHPDFESASHRIAAWRIPSSQRALNGQQLFEIESDDDGEKYGGKTLEKLLVSKGIQGAIVVARWYGGVMLGPVRFDHIRNCATEAISKWKQQVETSAKRAKTEADEQRQKDRLLRILRERDQSIAVLRDLLAEKSQQLTQQDAKSPSSKPPDYTAMPLVVLARLERARDATITFILKQIDKAEEESAKSPNDAKTEPEGPAGTDESMMPPSAISNDPEPTTNHETDPG